MLKKKKKGTPPGGKGSRCVGLTNLPSSCADYLEILGSSTSWSPKNLSRPIYGLLLYKQVSDLGSLTACLPDGPTLLACYTEESPIKLGHTIRLSLTFRERVQFQTL
jgi:hypothetical protein